MFICYCLCLGFDMFEKEFVIDGENVKIQLWWVSVCMYVHYTSHYIRDTAGQESYDSITTQYYRGGAVSVCVCVCARVCV